MNRIVFALLIATLASMRDLAQGTFRNLDFESANVRDLPSGDVEEVPVTQGIPGWTQYSSGHEEAIVGHNGLSGGGAIASILGPHYSEVPIIEGNYMAYMRPGTFVGNDLVIAQTGTLPADARSILFKAFGGTPSTVSLGGLPLNVIALQSAKSFTLYGADTTQFAGKTEELRFTTLGPFVAGNNGFFLDSIEFSTLVVPEPSAAILLTGGLGILAAWYRKK